MPPTARRGASPRTRRRPPGLLFLRLSAGSERNLLDTLRTERAGGTLLVLGALAALIWANSPLRDGYQLVRETVVGPPFLSMSLEHWATDGLLTIFFFVVGLELKRELVAGELRRLATAVVPVIAAIGGMIVPAAVYVAINTVSANGRVEGWAIPTATDIAFAVAILALVGRNLPNALRALLLTLAVVDDLLAIVVIAVFYGTQLHLAWLFASLLAVAAFTVLLRLRITSPFLLLPVALLAWVFMYKFGIHATMAGVALGLSVPASLRRGEHVPLAERLEHRWRPLSAGLAVPVFALLAAGVSLDLTTLGRAVRDPIAQGVVLGLVLGKPVGIVAATWIVARVTRTPLNPGVGWSDVFGLGMIAGIGFTVSLLIGSLAFGEGTASDDHVRVAILIASLTAAVVGVTILARRDRHHRLLAAAEGGAQTIG